MSDGAEEGSNRETVDRIEQSKRARADEFGREVAKVAVAQICESVGFDSLKESALEALTDIMVRYAQDLGMTASFYANLANRTECNVFDVVQGLEDLGSSTGFSGASEGAGCLTDSGIVREIIDFVSSVEEIPFAQPVPHFPLMRNQVRTPSFLQIGEIPSSNHIPSWLPAFPDRHTYVHTPTWNERETDPREDKIALAKQRRKAERSLLSLQQRLVSGGSELASTSAHEGVGNASQLFEASGNPFLAAPIPAEMRDISPVSLPAGLSNGGALENHASVLATFSPALEAVSSGVFSSDDNAKKNLPKERNDVYLSFKSSTKILGEPVDLRIRHKGSKEASCTERIDDKDDKKRRAQLILRLSTENRQELTLL